mmetsp:Transcript_30682/g.49642  ORF Transcript_30682/g.49642 Transcript_30682/m.49642 type:complete len:332 (-) Transcript_30682:58-1053(-)
MKKQLALATLLVAGSAVAYGARKWLRRQSGPETYSFKNAKLIRELIGHEDYVLALAIDSQANNLFSADQKGVVKVWSLSSGKLKQSFQAHEGSIFALLIQKGKLYSAATDGLLKAWHLTSLQLLKEVEAHQPVTLCLASDGERLYSGGADAKIKVWSLEDLELIIDVCPHDAAVRCLCVASNLLFSGAEDRTIKVWRASDMQELQCLRGHQDRVCALDSLFSNDQITLVSGSYDCSIKIWQGPSEGNRFECIKTVQFAHSGPVKTLIIHGDLVISGSWDRCVKTWRLPTCEDSAIYEGHNHFVLGVAALGRLVVSGSADKNIRMWELAVQV